MFYLVEDYVESSEGQEMLYAVCIAVDSYFPEARLVRGSEDNTTSLPASTTRCFAAGFRGYDAYSLS